MASKTLEQYKALVKFLGEVLGQDYEVALYDLTEKNYPAVAVANGQVTQLRTGNPLASAEVQRYTALCSGDSPMCFHIPLAAKDGHLLRSSAMLIGDQTDIRGLLRITFDDRRYEELCDRLLKLLHPKDFRDTLAPAESCKVSAAARSSFADHGSVVSKNKKEIPSMMDELFGEAVQELALPEGELDQEEKIKAVAYLYEHGLFEIKGAVPFAARKLSCSTASIYRYIHQLKNSPDPQA